MDDEKPQRKSSEVLLELEKMMIETRDLARNIDNNFKLILNKLNQQAGGVKRVRPVRPEDSAAPKRPPTVEADYQKSAEQLKAEKIATSPKEEVVFTQVKEPNVIIELPGKKTPVQQRLVYSNDDKNIYMAKVEILDKNGQLVKQIRTNQTGKWLAALPAGEYKVSVSKAASSNKPKVDYQYNIVIPDSTEAIELDTQKI